MTINKVANTDDVEYLSGGLGYSLNFAHGTPDNISIINDQTTSVAYNKNGLTITPGDAGTAARIEAVEFSTDPFSRVIFDGVFTASGANNFTHKIAIGPSSGVDSAYSMDWDWTNEQYRTTGSTKPSIAPPTGYERVYARFEADIANNETTFNAATENATDQVTFSGAPSYIRAPIVNTEAVSSGEGNVRVLLARLRIAPKV